jgi:hypothetical protein
MEDIWDLELELLRLFIFKLTNSKDFWAIAGIVRLSFVLEALREHYREHPQTPILG